MPGGGGGGFGGVCGGGVLLDFSSSRSSSSSSSTIFSVQVFMGMLMLNRRLTFLQKEENQAHVDKGFIQKLFDYLTIRREEWNSFLYIENANELNIKIGYMTDLLDSVESNNSSKTRELQEEKYIIKCKGYISHRLYDILVSQRATLIAEDIKNYRIAANSINELSDRELINKLADYLQSRSNQPASLFSNDNYQIDDRSKYIDKLIKSIIDKNIDEQKNLLKDENIDRFQGFFSQTLYLILITRRAELTGENLHDIGKINQSVNSGNEMVRVSERPFRCRGI